MCPRRVCVRKLASQFLRRRWLTDEIGLIRLWNLGFHP